MSGRLSVRQGETRYHVGIDWTHAADNDAIFLTGPLGQGLAELTRNARGARLLTADKQSLVAANWESLAEQAFGARLPLANLPRWVVGAAPSPSLDDSGRPRSANVDGWRIDYLDYDPASGLPALVELHRDDIEVRLRIDAWTLPP